ncbi:uncharacterized protein LOC110188478 [Drosophila serrata]|uniref:uncharacterized protein LOC110188478 n=1 Tax=Drosophila serrata TaxID=7274 RepID=UPI000A1D0E07|nr:uncharacterized protein LOC110188478 [Drosophila serrata]
MDRKHSVKGRLLILICYCSSSLQILHEFVLEDEQVFTDCINAPPGSRNASGLFDFSRMNFTMDENGIYIEGNLTTVWDVPPEDVILGDMSISYFDRGSWIPTLLNIHVKNVCNVLYDEEQYWYKYWLVHVTNVKDVKDKCLNNPGTQIIFEPFYCNVVLGLDMPLRSGRYLTTFMLTAQDSNGVKHENTICFSVRSEIHKIPKN